MAAGRIKGITIEIGGDTTKLTKALASVDNAISKTQSNLRDIDKALKIDPTNVSLLKDKQVELANQIDNAKQKLETEKQALDQLKNSEGFDKNSQKARDLQTQIDLDTAALKELEKQAKESASVMGSVFQAAGEKITAVGDQIKSVGDKISSLGQGLTTKVTTPIVAGLTAAVKTTADFDSQMSKVQAIAGASGEEFDQLRNKAREMGESTKFSATEAGQAFEYMGMAGWKTEDMLQGIPGILNLAAASGEELGTTSDIVTDALTAFGYGAEDAGRFADILASAATNANTNVSMMGESFKYVAPVAGSLGYSAEDVAVALGLMANSGIKADMAGTSLRNMFQRMAKPTKESQMAMDRLGLSLTDSEGNMLSFRDIMDQMRGAFSEINMSAADYDAAIEQLDQDLADGVLTQKKYDAELEELNKQAFGAEGAEKARAAAMLGGTRAMSGLLAIANATEDDYNSLTKAIDTSSDAFAKLADGSVVPLSEALESGAEVIKTYNGQAEAMADTMMNNLTGDITVLKSKLQELAISFGDLLMPTIRSVVEKIQEFVDKLNAMDDAQKEEIIRIAAIVAAIGPALLIIGKVVTAVGSIVGAIGKVTSAMGKLMTILAGVSAPVLAVIAVITALVAAFVYLYKNNEEFANKVNETFANLKAKFEEAWQAIQPALEELGQAFADLMEALEPVFEAIMEFIAALLEGVMAALPTIMDAVKNAVEFITNIVQAFIALFRGDFDQVFEHLKAAGKSFFDMWKNIYKAGLDALVGFFDHFGIDIKAKIHAMIVNIVNTWTNLISSCKTYAANVTTTIKDGIGVAIDWIKSLPSQAWQWGADIINGIADGIRGAISHVTDAVKSVADVIASYIHFTEPDVGPLSNFHTFMPDMMREMANGITRNLPQLESAMNKMAGTLVPQAGELTAGAAGRGSVTTNNIQMTIYGAQGQDVRRLADIIQNRINNEVLSREAVFA